MLKLIYANTTQHRLPALPLGEVSRDLGEVVVACSPLPIPFAVEVLLYSLQKSTLMGGKTTVYYSYLMMSPKQGHFRLLGAKTGLFIVNSKRYK